MAATSINMGGKKLPPCRRVAIVGGGFCGLVSIKSLKEEGIEPICFEKTPNFGGTWCYREEEVDGVASVMWTTIVNHSKEMGMLSDYPFPKELPNFMKHSEIYLQFQDMAKKFDLIKHMRFNCEVVRISKAHDYEYTGRWTVSVRNVEKDEVSTDVYDGVIICTGQMAYPKWPTFDGMEKFSGQILHSHSLKRTHGFIGKKVVVVGIGCSALDAAVEISSVADKVYLSTRTPSYILSRVGPHGMPFDYCLLRRYVALFQDILPLKWASKLFEHIYIDTNFNHKMFGIKPKYPFLSRDPFLNDQIGSKFLSGSVLLRKNIERFEEDGVVFEGEGNKTEVDVVIMATGYQWKFPFLDDGIIEINGNKVNLYKCIFPTQLQHHTLAFLGFILPIGPGWPLGELQARWVAQVFSGNCSLPDQKIMTKDVDQRHERNSKRYSPSDKMTVRVDYIPYADEIASQFGAKPNFWKMMFTDPRLFMSCVFGPSLPCQYRLCGPHKWPPAREYILTAPERMQLPLSDPNKSFTKTLRNYFVGHIYLILLLVFVCLLIAYPFMSWKTISICSTVFYAITIVVIFGKNIGDIAVNRSFWY